MIIDDSLKWHGPCIVPLLTRLVVVVTPRPWVEHKLVWEMLVVGRSSEHLDSDVKLHGNILV